MFFVSIQKILTFIKGGLPNSAILCASQINAKVLQEECNMGEKLEQSEHIQKTFSQFDY